MRHGKRKIRWAKWDFLGLPKEMGGLGFRDLSLFNQALLAKQVWKLQNNPESLICRVLKAKYFKRDSLPQVKMKPGISFMWRSLLWGRELLLKRLRWRVGNGTSIQVFNDPWLPFLRYFRPITPGDDNELTVSSLMCPNNREWDVEQIRHSFLDIDASKIMSIPISLSDCPDILTWHHQKQGAYDVSSGYKGAVQDPIQEASSNSRPGVQWWRRLWKLQIPPKVKVFIWRA